MGKSLASAISALFRSGKLPNPFKDGRADRVGEVKASGLGLIDHGQGNAAIIAVDPRNPVLNHILDAFGFAAEQQVIAFQKFGVPMRPRRFRGVKPEPPGRRSLGCQKRLPTLVFAAINEMPIVQPRATPSLLVHVESDGMNDMKATIGRGAGAPNGPGVVRDFGIQKHDMEAWGLQSESRKTGSWRWSCEVYERNRDVGGLIRLQFRLSASRAADIMMRF